MSGKPNQKSNPRAPKVYQIKIKGHLGNQWSDWFDGLTITPDKEGNTLLTNGGRVLNVTANGPDIPGAIVNAYEAVGKIHFDRAHYRTDIGKKAFKHLGC